MAIKIGVLAIHSNAIPHLGRNFSNGLKLALEENNIDFSIVVEGVGNGSDPKTLADKAQKLVLQDDVHVLTGLFGHRGITELREYAEAVETPLVSSDLGAAIPASEKLNEWCFNISADQWHSAYLFGKNAPAWSLKEIGIASSYYDSGYGHSEALERGLRVGGGEFSGHYVTPLKPRENEAEIFNYFLEESKPKAIYAITSGIFAEEFASYLGESENAKGIPVYASVETVHDKALQGFGAQLKGVKVITPWTPKLNTAGNKRFVAAFDENYDKAPDYFSLLGYETGLAIAHAVKSIDKKVTNASIKKALRNVELEEGPRGKFKFESDCNRYLPDHHLWEVVENAGVYEMKALENLGVDKDAYLSLIDEEEDGKRGGWFNPYLCH